MLATEFAEDFNCRRLMLAGVIRIRLCIVYSVLISDWNILESSANSVANIYSVGFFKTKWIKKVLSRTRMSIIQNFICCISKNFMLSSGADGQNQKSIEWHYTHGLYFWMRCNNSIKISLTIALLTSKLYSFGNIYTSERTKIERGIFYSFVTSSTDQEELMLHTGITCNYLSQSVFLG